MQTSAPAKTAPKHMPEIFRISNLNPNSLPKTGQTERRVEFPLLKFQLPGRPNGRGEAVVKKIGRFIARMKKSGWKEFILVIVICFVGGAILGCLAFLLVDYRGILRAFAKNRPNWAIICFLVVAAVGGFIAVCTIPRWKTPWYKGIHAEEEDDDD
jgi:preprotein translocase subunit Sss1